MKLLFDENLARDLVSRLADQFPASKHVYDAGLEHSLDRDVWEFAKVGGFVLVSKDSDFNQLAFLYGPTPKVIWLRVGNCTTGLIERMLRQRSVEIGEFVREPAASVLVIE